MGEGSLSNDVHDEFVKRVDEHFDRIDARLSVLESEMKSYSELALSIQRLSLSTETMCSELKEQGKRLETLEDRDGQKWRSTVSSVITVIVGAILGYLLSMAGIVA